MRFVYLTILILLSSAAFGQTTDSITLKEVTVSAKNVITTPDKTIIIPTAQVKKNSFDGYTMLSLMKVPDLKVDVFGNMVASNDGTGILICINGVEASNEEIKALNPKYVKKIDYYTNFDPRHLQADRVLDFIVNPRETGGELMVRANLHLNLLEGEDMVYWKIFSGNTEISLSVKDNYKRYRNGIGNTERTVMRFTDTEIIRNSFSLPSLERDNGVGGGATLLHRWDNALFKGGISINNVHDIDSKGNRISYTGAEITDAESHTHVHKDMTYTNLKLQYDQGFRNKSILSFSINAGYNHTDNSREYASIDRYCSDTDEKYYSLSPGISYTMPFMDKKLSVFAKINHFYESSRQEYTENDKESDQTFTYNETLLQLGANIKFIKDLSATVRLQDRILYRSSTNINEKSDKHTFTPSVMLSYRLKNGDRLSTFWTSGLFSPNLSYFSTVEKRIDEFTILVGNPDLRLEGILDGRISYTHYCPWGYVSPEIHFSRRFHPVYQTYVCDPGRMVYIRTFLNGGNSTSFSPHLYTSVTLIPDKLYTWCNVAYKYRQIHTYTAITRQCVTGEAGLTYLNNGLSGEISCSLPWKDLLDDGLYVRRPMDLKLSLNYNHRGWSFSFLAKNPLCKVKHSYIYSLPDGFEEHNTTRVPQVNYNYLEARIGYRFSYGKQHKFQNVDVNDHAGSAILGF